MKKMYKQYSEAYSKDVVYPVKTSERAEEVLVMTEADLVRLVCFADEHKSGIRPRIVAEWLQRELSKGE